MPYNVQQPSYPAYSHAPSHGARCAVRRVRYAVLGARRVVRGARKLPFSATVVTTAFRRLQFCSTKGRYRTRSNGTRGVVSL